MADDRPEPSDPVSEPVVDDAPAETSTKSAAETSAESATEAAAETAKPTGAVAAKPEGAVVRKKVTSKRVTPKGSPQGAKAKGSGPSGRSSSADDDDAPHSKRYTPPKATYAPGPSPWWVPALMFAFLIIGALVIMANYMGAFGDADNIRLVIGLAFILAGIVTATQYR
ncbi:MAG TPA: cell division protein CrgA [Aquihabitans sp.]|jgi:pyruvate/2-oxoglutarate dehydrogenase complex dihydrolipoamide acyltransferase (E2) component|nr:cell division protein CrgA [Aquihabitans sp.]